MPEPIDSLTATRAWLTAFASAVRARDFASGRALCDHDVEGFGTVAGRYVGLDALESEQWKPVWGRTQGFVFDIEQATVWTVGNQSTAIVNWQSEGVDPDGSLRDRSGQATIIVRHHPDGTRATHTHFSMTPGSRA